MTAANSIILCCLPVLFAEVFDSIFSRFPISYLLGFPSKNAPSAYYLGLLSITSQEVADISRVMEDKWVLPENTNLESEKNCRIVLEVLQAAVETTKPRDLISNQIHPCALSRATIMRNLKPFVLV